MGSYAFPSSCTFCYSTTNNKMNLNRNTAIFVQKYIWAVYKITKVDRCVSYLYFWKLKYFQLQGALSLALWPGALLLDLAGVTPPDSHYRLALSARHIDAPTANGPKWHFGSKWLFDTVGFVSARRIWSIDMNLPLLCGSLRLWLNSLKSLHKFFREMRNCAAVSRQDKSQKALLLRAKVAIVNQCCKQAV